MGPSTHEEGFFLMKTVISCRLLPLLCGGGWDESVMAGGVEAGGDGGQEDNSLAKSSPHAQERLSVKTAWISEPMGRKEQANSSILLVKLRPRVV